LDEYRDKQLIILLEKACWHLVWIVAESTRHSVSWTKWISLVVRCQKKLEKREVLNVDTNMKIAIKEALKFQKTGDYIHIFIDLENEISFLYS
jgi:hypothetical protein